MNKRIFLVGSTQTKHIAKLLKKYGVNCIDINDIKEYRTILRKILYLKLLVTSDVIYCVGGVVNYNWILILSRIFRKKIVRHWIGTDVLNAYKKVELGKELPKYDVEIAGSDLLCKELAAISIEAKQIPIVPFRNEFILKKMPQKHAVLAYLPEGREKFYGSEILLELVKREPNIMFHIVANRGVEYMKFPNVKFYGFLNEDEMRNLYNEVTILFRYPEHDGLSMMVIEALGYGKNVLYKYKHPYVVTPESENIEDIYVALKKIIDMPIAINEKGHAFVTEFYSAQNIMNLYKENHIFD